MNPSERMLWTRIEQFRLDDPAISFPFSHRVARENGWTQHYTLRVIEEYKKFIFLCCVAGSGVTPSDPVDQVWHLHLTFTRSYWNDFCSQTLQREIHHNPTKGGQHEAQRFDRYYTSTRVIYRAKFDALPPADVWQPNTVRFSDIDFQRVNRGRYWLVKKPGALLKKRIGLSALLVAGAASIYAVAGILISAGFMALLVVIIYKSGSKDGRTAGNGNDGGWMGTTGSDTSSDSTADSSSHHGHHHDSTGADSGCSSGCSGCSSSGCSGCSGGGD